LGENKLGERCERMRKKGFTLIELLVVISIIALLLAILMPGLQKAKAAAKALVCRNNQKQLSNAFQSYYLDYDFKSMESGGEEKFWFLQIGPYLSDGAFSEQDYADKKDPESTMKSSMAVNKCPATKPPVDSYGSPSIWDPSQPAFAQSEGGRARNQYRYHEVRVEGSYTMNSWVGGYSGAFDPKLEVVGPRTASANLAQSYRGNPAAGRGDVPLLADGVWVEALPLSGDNAPYDLSVLTEDGDVDWRDGLQRFATNRHGLNTNVAYCDGHVEKIKLEGLWAQRWYKKFKVDRDVIVPRDDDRGDN
jgi:prepilin-type N-terminal cleavage/methylation domain-containing protein/prepilin-type processing-associated H-X9-DG protein